MGIKGIDQLVKKFEGMARRAKELEGPHEVTIVELMSPTFVAGCSKFGTFAELVETSGCKLETKEDLTSEAWNKFVAANTRFENWEAMWREAGAEWMKAKALKALRS